MQFRCVRPVEAIVAIIEHFPKNSTYNIAQPLDALSKITKTIQPTIQSSPEWLAIQEITKNILGFLNGETFLKSDIPSLKNAWQAIDNLLPEEAIPDAAQAPGGISMNDEHLTINIKVDGAGMPLPAIEQDPAMMNLDGLSPVIREISPATSVNIPVLSELIQMGAHPV